MDVDHRLKPRVLPGLLQRRVGGVIELLIGVEAARKSLEDVASPLSAEQEQPAAA